MFVLNDANPTIDELEKELSDDEMIDFATMILQDAATSLLDTVKKQDVLTNKQPPQMQAVIAFFQMLAEYTKGDSHFLMPEQGEVAAIAVVCSPADHTALAVTNAIERLESSSQGLAVVVRSNQVGGALINAARNNAEARKAETETDEAIARGMDMVQELPTKFKHFLANTKETQSCCQELYKLTKDVRKTVMQDFKKNAGMKDRLKQLEDDFFASMLAGVNGCIKAGLTSSVKNCLDNETAGSVYDAGHLGELTQGFSLDFKPLEGLLKTEAKEKIADYEKVGANLAHLTQHAMRSGFHNKAVGTGKHEIPDNALKDILTYDATTLVAFGVDESLCQSFFEKFKPCAEKVFAEKDATCNAALGTAMTQILPKEIKEGEVAYLADSTEVLNVIASLEKDMASGEFSGSVAEHVLCLAKLQVQFSQMVVEDKNNTPNKVVQKRQAEARPKQIGALRQLVDVVNKGLSKLEAVADGQDHR